MKICFCLPGNNFSLGFIGCWTDLVRHLDLNGIEYNVRFYYQADMYHVRNKLVITPQETTWIEDTDNIKPFVDKDGVRYDASMWIDSDIIFSPKDFMVTLNTMLADEHAKVDMITGFYMMDPEKDITVVGEFATEEEPTVYWKMKAIKEFAENEPYNLMPCDFSGFGWVLIKTKVFDSMTYPYFWAMPKKKGTTKIFSTSDIYFFKKAQELGFQLYAQPQVRLGHEKSIVWR